MKGYHRLPAYRLFLGTGATMRGVPYNWANSVRTGLMELKGRNKTRKQPKYQTHHPESKMSGL